MRTRGFTAETTTETVKTTTLRLTGADILKLLRFPEEGSKVAFEIPAGDYPTSDLWPIDADMPIVVTVQARTSRSKGGAEPATRKHDAERPIPLVPGT